MRDTIKAAVICLTISDVLGVPVEFCKRSSLKANPVTDMRGYGTYNMPIGTYSDDTSMTLCLIDSLAGGLNYNDIMNKFEKWLYDGAYTQYNNTFDVGRTCMTAISRYKNGTPALECGGSKERENGNGSLMRILPVLFYVHHKYGKDFFDNGEAVEIIHNISRLTHAHPRSLIACGIYISIAGFLLDGVEVEKSVSCGIGRAIDYYKCKPEFAEETGHFSRLENPSFKDVPEDDIDSSGYVIDTLECSIWCLLNTDNYFDCALKAVNMGGDTDTISCVAGGLAGLAYGLSSIPKEWTSSVPKLSYIEELCDNFYKSLAEA